MRKIKFAQVGIHIRHRACHCDNLRFALKIDDTVDNRSICVGKICFVCKIFCLASLVPSNIIT